jgi:hypothetical protein
VQLTNKFAISADLQRCVVLHQEDSHDIMTVYNVADGTNTSFVTSIFVSGLGGGGGVGVGVVQ